MLRPPTSQKAFTLIEVMLAATVLLVGISGMIYAVPMGTEMLDTARKQQIAQQIIDGEVARLRGLTWGGFPGQLGIGDMTNNPTFRIWVMDDGSIGYDPVGSISVPAYFALNTNPILKNMAKGFSCQADSTNLKPWTATPLLAVKYTVTWSSSTGRVHTRSGVTYLAKNGLHLSYSK